MDSIAGPSIGNSNIFSAKVQTLDVSQIGREFSFSSNIDPDFKWMKDSVNYLIHLVSIHFDEFYDKTLKKKVLWKKIAEEMKVAGYSKCTAEDCDRKWRNIKKSYLNVLIKQTQGDFSSKFPYFHQIHAFLGKEIDPSGKRDSRLKLSISPLVGKSFTSAMKAQKKVTVRTTSATPSLIPHDLTRLEEAISKNKATYQDEFPKIPFYEVIEDENFIWSESAVHRLLDLILEHKEIFKVNKDVDLVWKSIANIMPDEGYNVLGEQCQRKWLNLSEGFRHHQAEAEATGIPPKWSFFPRVRGVINTFNVPVTVFTDHRIAPHFKESLTSSPFISKDQQFGAVNESRKRKRSEIINGNHETDEEEEEEEEEDRMHDDLPRKFFGALRRLHSSLREEKRLPRLEARIEAAQKWKAATKYSNNKLSLILGKLKRINESFEHGKEQLFKEDQEGVDRLKEERLILNKGYNHIVPSFSILDNAYHQAILNIQDPRQTQAIPNIQDPRQTQAILNMPDFTNFTFMKTPEVELIDDYENDGIIIDEFL